MCTNGAPFTFVLYIVRIIDLDDGVKIPHLHPFSSL